ncbi:PAS domain-containing protein [bacterium]|nr:PAS domain-containing protein [bacterium]
MTKTGKNTPGGKTAEGAVQHVPTPDMKSELPLNGAVPGDVKPETVDFMRGLIESFNASAAKLKEAYSALQEKFDRLNLRLEETNRELTISLAEQERLSNYLTNILESLSSGVLVIDTGGRITLFNRGAETITGIQTSDAQGKQYSEVMGGTTPVELTPLRTLSNGERRSNMEKRLTARNGQQIPVGFSTSPLLNKAGEMIGAVEIFMDLSRIKALEEEISRMDKLAALGQMAATMAHKIRNPLGGIAGFTGLLQLELDENDNGKRLLGKITEGVDKLDRIITSLLSYTARLRLNTRLVDLGERMTRVIEVLRDERPGDTEGVEFGLDLPAGPVSAEVDSEHFTGAMLNIVRNAVEAIDGDGKITVRICHGGFDMKPACPLTVKLLGRIRESSGLAKTGLPGAIITVTDTGAGMDDDVIDKLFVPFFTTKENGIGLGLAAARKVIEAHHGEIWIESESGAGTAVGVVLPGTNMA